MLEPTIAAIPAIRCALPVMFSYRSDCELYFYNLKRRNTVLLTCQTKSGETNGLIKIGAVVKIVTLGAASLKQVEPIMRVKRPVVSFFCRNARFIFCPPGYVSRIYYPAIKHNDAMYVAGLNESNCALQRF